MDNIEFILISKYCVLSRHNIFGSGNIRRHIVYVCKSRLEKRGHSQNDTLPHFAIEIQ